MTLPKEIQDAFSEAFAWTGSEPTFRHLETIRAYLLSQDAEISNLRSAAQKAVLSNVELRTRAELTESRLNTAHALLKTEAILLRTWACESREGGWSTHQVGPMNKRADEIDARIAQPAQAVDVVAWRYRDNVRPGLPWELTDDFSLFVRIKADGGYEIEPLITTREKK